MTLCEKDGQVLAFVAASFAAAVEFKVVVDVQGDVGSFPWWGKQTTTAGGKETFAGGSMTQSGDPISEAHTCDLTTIIHSEQARKHD